MRNIDSKSRPRTQFRFKYLAVRIRLLRLGGSLTTFSTVSVKSRHMQCTTACPLYPRKRTCAVQLAMSALGQKRTLPTSLNHLVGGSHQRRRNCEAQRLGGLEIDDKLDFGRKFHRQVAGFGALQDFVDIVSRAMEARVEIDPVANKAAGFDVFAVAIYRG